MSSRKHRDTVFAMLKPLVILALLLDGTLAIAHNVHSAPHEVHVDAQVEPKEDVQQLIRLFRETGDDAHLDTAWARLEPQLGEQALAPGELVDAAMLAQSRHDFTLALELLDRALEQQPHIPQAWLLRAAIELVRGNVDDALDACRQLRSSTALVAVTCHARVAIARGDSRRALGQLTAVLAHIDEDRVDADRLAWSLSVAGDAAAGFDPELAVSLYRRSLALVESAQVRSALVDTLLHLDRLEDADAELDRGSAALPLVVRRLIVAVRAGREGEFTVDIGNTDRRFRYWIAHEDWLHAREMARFYLDVLPRPALARRLAVKNLELQREPEDLRLARRSASLPAADVKPRS